MRRPTTALLTLALCLGLATSDLHAQDATAPRSVEVIEGEWNRAEGDARHDLALELARALRRAGDPSRAASVLLPVVRERGGVEEHRERGRALLDFAKQVLARGEIGMSIKAAFVDALRALGEARKAGAEDPELFTEIAYAADAVGETAIRLRSLERGRELHPDSTVLTRAHAFALLDAEQDAEAMQLFEGLSAATPEDARLARALSYTARRAGREELARLGAERAIATAPTDAAGWLSLWQLYAPQNRYGELADAVLGQAQAYPDNAVAAHYAGYACSNARRFDDALTWLGRAVELDPANIIARTEMARIHRDETGDTEQAAAIYQEVLRKHPESTEALVGLGFLAQRLGGDLRHEEALPLFRALAEAQPDEGQAWANLALALRWTGRYEAADEAYTRALLATPDDAQVWNDYGLLLMVMQRDADAAEAFLSGGRADESHNDGSENLAFMARERGDQAETLRWFRDAWERARMRGEDGARHRRNLDDTRHPLETLQLHRE